MGFVSFIYGKLFIHRYDDNGYIKYFSAADFPGLQAQPISFRSGGNELRGFFYGYPGARTDTLIVFCHGIGGGHRSYMTEIDRICRAGYSVFAYDNTGCFASQGESIGSMSRSLADLDSAIKYLKSEGIFAKYQNVYCIGHSWGGFAVGNIPRFHPDISKIVVISGFLSVEGLLTSSLANVRLPAEQGLIKKIMAFEQAAAPEYWDAYLPDAVKLGTAKYLFAHSTDDPMVPFAPNTGLLQTLCPEQTFLVYGDRAHNPNYTADAVNYMQQTFGRFNKLNHAGRLPTLEKKRAFFAETDWRRMTAQDEDFWTRVFGFLDGEAR